MRAHGYLCFWVWSLGLRAYWEVQVWGASNYRAISSLKPTSKVPVNLQVGFAFWPFAAAVLTFVFCGRGVGGGGGVLPIASCFWQGGVMFT